MQKVEEWYNDMSISQIVHTDVFNDTNWGFFLSQLVNYLSVK